MEALTPVTFELPWPPSVNHYYRRVGSRTLISRAGREFRRQAGRILAAHRVAPATGRLAVSVEVCPPDRRRRDIDNLLKAVLDACQHGGAFPDDGRIIWLLIQRSQVVPGGRVVVTIRDLSAGQQPPDDVAIWFPSWNEGEDRMGEQLLERTNEDKAKAAQGATVAASPATHLGRDDKRCPARSTGRRSARRTGRIAKNAFKPVRTGGTPARTTALNMPHDPIMGARTLIELFDADYLRALVTFLKKHLEGVAA